MLNFSNVQEQIFQSETGATGKKLIVTKLIVRREGWKEHRDTALFLLEVCLYFFFAVVEERANAVTAGICNIKMLSPLS